MNRFQPILNYLRSIVADIESGKAKLVEHDLIEDCVYKITLGKERGKNTASGKTRIRKHSSELIL